ncbi:MAG: septum formation initiator family protein [Dysgonamonadaceae bacterium]|jgi:cell division protein FtsB|nr:septum formation initiator family protein [Dysgonamonadaceae bacterium]
MKRIWLFISKLSSKINKYWLTLIVFMIVTQFFGDSNILDRISYNRQISELESEIKFYQAEKKKNQEKIDAIQSNPEGLEKFAREQYIMAAPGEDIFIIKE